MRVYRICREPFAALDGEGARLYGGRWNRPGRPAVYAATSRALAALEYLVHVEPADVPGDLILLTIELPDDVRREEVDPATLPVGWNQVAGHPACQDRGDAWLAAGASAALEAPSAPIPEERNVIVNSRHPESVRVVEVDRRPFVFDPRLL
jgi:RES domain-containing protein